MIRPWLLTVGLCFFAANALACPMLESASPKVGSELDAPPDHVEVHFTSTIFPEKSTLIVQDAAGKEVETGKPYGSELVIAARLKPLPAGTYKVTWNVLCDCGSLTPGHYKFTVR